MKKILFFLILIGSISLYNSGCGIVDDQNNDPDEEQLPPDDDPVYGEINGTINEEVYTIEESSSSVLINRIPHTLGKFLELQQDIATTPQGAAMMMLVAFRIYQQYPTEGKKCLTAATTFPLVSASSEDGSYEGEIITNVSELTRKLNDYPHLPFVYYQGAAPDNAYTPDGPPYSAEFSVNTWSYITGSDGLRIKTFVHSKAADSARPVTSKKVDGIYRVTEFSSLYLAPKDIIN
jgi:hypothetical protein